MLLHMFSNMSRDCTMFASHIWKFLPTGHDCPSQENCECSVHGGEDDVSASVRGWGDATCSAAATKCTLVPFQVPPWTLVRFPAGSTSSSVTPSDDAREGDACCSAAATKWTIELELTGRTRDGGGGGGGGGGNGAATCTVAVKDAGKAGATIEALWESYQA